MRYSDSRSQQGSGSQGDDQWLPDDLLPLIDQLRREAVDLAGMYPPKPAILDDLDPVPVTTESGRRHHLRWVAAAMLVLCAGMGAWSFVSRTSHAPSFGQAATDHAPAAIHQLASGLSGSHGSSEVADTLYVPELTPAAFVHDFSGPELEAWLDLRSAQDLGREHLSL